MFHRKKVEQDLERIRIANMHQEARDEYERTKLAEKEELEKITAKQTFAMVIAIFSVLLPYLLVFFFVIGLLMFFLS